MDHPLAPADPPPIDGVYNVYNAKEAPSPSPRPASTAGTHPTPPDVFWTSNYHQAKQKMEKFKKTVNDVVRINRVKKTIAARAKEDTIKFLRTTPLHGFDYIADAENKLQFAFWALLMLFVSAFAVRDTVNMIISYKEAPPAVSSLEAIILPMNHFSETALCLLTRPEDYQPFEFNATLASITNEFYERINILMNRVMNDPTSSMAQALEEIINDKNIQTSRISVKEDQYNHMTSNIKGEVFSLLTAVSAMESYPFTQLGVDRNIVPFVKLNSLKQFYSNRNASIPVSLLNGR
uniref:Uncharacterized protein n=1 Tax=Plectus sambesii TaxID=2011161 RepID=A0A914WIG6_9BILA